MVSSIAARTSAGRSVCGMCPAPSTRWRTAPVTTSACAAGMMRSALPQTHRDRHRAADRAEGRRGLHALRVAVEQEAWQGVQGLVHAVQALVGEEVVNYLAGDQAVVGKELADLRLELAPRLRVGEAAQVADIPQEPPGYKLDRTSWLSWIRPGPEPRSYGR